MLSALLLWLLLVTAGTTQKVGLDSALGFGCWNAAFKWNFSCPPEWVPYDCRCKNDNFLATALNCVNEFARNGENVEQGYHYIRSQCFYWGNRDLARSDLDRIYHGSKQDLSTAPTNDTEKIVLHPIRVPTTLYQQQYHRGLDAAHHYYLGTVFGLAMVGYWAFIIALATTFHTLSLMCGAKISQPKSQVINWFKKYFILPPLIGNKHHDDYRVVSWFSVRAPTRAQATIILGFIGLNLFAILSFYDHRNNPPLTIPDNRDKILKELANRTGIIAISFLPIIVLFAIRNNPFIFVTGWPYETFQLFHRWNARFMATHAVIHGAAMIWFSARQKIIIFKWEHVHNWTGGNLALFGVLCILIIALRSIRSRVYEWFLCVHQIMFALVFVAMVVHCSDYGWLEWLWITVAIYVFEYAARIFKIWYSGGIQKAEFTLVASDMFQVQVVGRRHWKVQPGNYAYLRVLMGHLAGEAHPFSVFQKPSGAKCDSLDFMIKGKKGFTKKMINYLNTTPKGKAFLDVVIDGPYGNVHDITRYNSAFILAGGVGITAMYSYVYARAARSRSEPGQRICLVWVIQDEDALAGFSEEVTSLLNLKTDATIKIYLSRPKYTAGTVSTGSLRLSMVSAPREKGDSQVSITTEEKPDRFSNEMTDIDFKGVTEATRISQLDASIFDKLYYGRPPVGDDLKSFIIQSPGSVAICSCGPPKFVDAARNSIVSNMQDAVSRVNYFEEAFSW